MPLKRSSSLAMPFARGGKGENGRKGVHITKCSPEDWAATLAMLSNMPRAHFTRRPHRNSDSENTSSSRSKNPAQRQRSSSDGKPSSGGSSENVSANSKRSTSSSKHKQHYHYRQGVAAAAPATTTTTTRTTSTPSRNPSSSKSSSREVHVKALGELQTAAARLPHPEVVYGAMIPEPDYSDDEREATVTKQAALITRNNQVNASSPAKKENKEELPINSDRLDENGLIMPKKLVNPCLESTDKKSLHRELLYNQKRGVNVLNQKTELQKAMEKHNDKKVLKEIQKEKEAALTPFQKALDERAQKIEQSEKAENKDAENEKSTCEFQKIHAKVRAKMEVQ